MPGKDTNKKHLCEEFKHVKNNFGMRYLDYMDYWTKIQAASWISEHGQAIEYIEYVDGLDIWVAHCDEYATIIKYCPFCGEEL